MPISKALTSDQMIRIARAGGGMDLRGKNLTVDQKIRIARAASGVPGTRIIFSPGVATSEQMISIGRAGAGSVLFKD